MGRRPKQTSLKIRHTDGQVKVKMLVTQLCPTLCHLMDCNPPDSSVHGILQARILEWNALHQGIFPNQGVNLGLLHCRSILYPLSHLGSLPQIPHIEMPKKDMNDAQHH